MYLFLNTFFSPIMSFTQNPRKFCLPHTLWQTLLQLDLYRLYFVRTNDYRNTVKVQVLMLNWISTVPKETVTQACEVGSLLLNHSGRPSISKHFTLQIETGTELFTKAFDWIAFPRHLLNKSSPMEIFLSCHSISSLNHRLMWPTISYISADNRHNGAQQLTHTTFVVS